MTEEPIGEELDLLAAEYALGLLEGEALEDAGRRGARDPAFAALVEGWTVRFAPLFSAFRSLEPDPGLWDRISASLEQPDKRPVEFASVRRRLTLWKSYSAAVSVLAFSLLLAVVLREPEQQSAPAPAVRPVMVATLAPEAGPPRVTAAYDPATNSLVVAPVALSTVPGHDHELWIIPEGGTPQSLGLVSPDGQRRFPLPPELSSRLVATATIALSNEPAGGSRTGQPTGPVVASGTFSAV